MTLRIGVGLSFYQDFDSLRRMLMSLQGYPIHKIIAVDGKYDKHPGKDWYSSTECRDLFTMKGFQTHTLLITPPTHIPLTEIRKRQMYFDNAFNMDALIVMDSDEYIVHEATTWFVFIQQLKEKIEQHRNIWIQGYCIPVILKNKGMKNMPEGYSENLPRVFVRPSELQYVDNHYMVRNKKTGVLMRYPSETLLIGLTLGHDHNLRSIEYLEQRQIYQERLIEEEKNRMIERQNEFSHRNTG